VKTVNPSAWTAKKARNLEIYLRKSILAIYFLELVITVIDYVLSVNSRKDIQDFSHIIITDFNYYTLDLA
jgi:hypothetical protein